MDAKKQKQLLDRKRYRCVGLLVAGLLLSLIFAACSRDPAACRHKFGQYTVERDPGCLSAGSQTRVCKRCGFSEESEIPALGHHMEIVPGVEETCTRDGFTEQRYCSACGEILAPGIRIEATGHTPVVDSPAAAPTCTEQGFSEASHCSVCGVTLSERKRLYALGHEAVLDPAVPFTCTEPGLTEGRHCSRCGEVIHAQTVIESTGHIYLDGVCIRCGHGSDSEPVPETWHGDYEKADFLDVRKFGVGSTQWDGSLPLRGRAPIPSSRSARPRHSRRSGCP